MSGTEAERLGAELVMLIRREQEAERVVRAARAARVALEQHVKDMGQGALYGATGAQHVVSEQRVPQTSASDLDGIRQSREDTRRLSAADTAVITREVPCPGQDVCAYWQRSHWHGGDEKIWLT